MANRDGVVTDQDFFDNEAHDSFTLSDIKCFCSLAQPDKECSQGLGESQEGIPIGGLIGDPCNSERSVCSRWRRTGMRSRNCSIDKRLPDRR